MPTPNQTRLAAYYEMVREKYKEIGNMAEVGRIFNIDRQRVHQIIRGRKARAK